MRVQTLDVSGQGDCVRVGGNGCNRQTGTAPGAHFEDGALMCGGKVRFRNRKLARQAYEKMVTVMKLSPGAYKGDSPGFYRCPECGKWHLTTHKRKSEAA